MARWISLNSGTLNKNEGVGNCEQIKMQMGRLNLESSSIPRVIADEVGAPQTPTDRRPPCDDPNRNLTKLKRDTQATQRNPREAAQQDPTAHDSMQLKQAKNQTPEEERKRNRKKKKPSIKELPSVAHSGSSSRRGSRDACECSGV